MARPAGPIPQHGTRQRYQLRGTPCRCVTCSKANADYQMIKRTGSTQRSFAWGTHSGYYPRQRQRRPRHDQPTLPPEYLTGWIR